MLKVFNGQDGSFTVIEYRLEKGRLVEVNAALGYDRVKDATEAVHGKPLTFRPVI